MVSVETNHNCIILIMVHTKRINLTWHTFQGTTSNTFNNLFEDKDFTDVTLVCDEDKQIKAHKVILSSGSSFFRKILTRNPHQHPLVYLRGLTYSDLLAVVKFLYFGEIEIFQDNLDNFMLIAKELEIEGLMDMEQKDTSPDEPVELKHSTQINISKLEETETNETKKLYCDICLKAFTQYGNLNRHKKSVHEGQSASCDYTLHCDQCDKTFTQHGSLSRHKKSVHEGLRYFCLYCPGEFSQSSKLTNHVKIDHADN